jgi:hypothetical protein
VIVSKGHSKIVYRTRHTYVNVEKVSREYPYKDRLLIEVDIAVVVLPIGSLGY